ncbi:MAG: dihydrofolate reductase [Leadbetterella sp.]
MLSSFPLSLIVAVANNGVIGSDNTLIWKLSDDLKQFKARTTGHTIIMGRKTYDSIGKPLPNRRNIVISRNSGLQIENVEIFGSLEAVIEHLNAENHTEEVFVIGGEAIYKIAEPFVNKIYLTLVDAEPQGDAFFDSSPYKSWRVLNETLYSKNDKNEYDFRVVEKAKNAKNAI